MQLNMHCKNKLTNAAKLWRVQSFVLLFLLFWETLIERYWDGWRESGGLFLMWVLSRQLLGVGHISVFNLFKSAITSLFPLFLLLASTENIWEESVPPPKRKCRGNHYDYRSSPPLLGPGKPQKVQRESKLQLNTKFKFAFSIMHMEGWGEILLNTVVDFVFWKEKKNNDSRSPFSSAEPIWSKYKPRNWMRVRNSKKKW